MMHWLMSIGRFKSATENEFANIRDDNKKTIDLLCIMSVELIGKDAVVQYCTQGETND